MRTQKEILDSYEKFYDMVWRVCLMQLGNSHDACDATQETFIRLMNCSKFFCSEEHEKAWLIRVATNYCRDVMKSSHRKREVALETDKPPEAGMIPDVYNEKDIEYICDRTYEIDAGKISGNDVPEHQFTP